MSRPLSFLTVDQLASLPEPEWLIDGVIPAGLSILYGASGSGKSFLALDWALSIASGAPWLGRPVKRGCVVYIAGEGLGGLGKRYSAWVSHHDEQGDLLAVLAEPINLLNEDDVRRLQAAVAELSTKPVLYIVDTLARCMVGGDENSARDVGQVIDSIDRLRGDGSALVIHHTGKTGSGERGSSALRGAADLMATLAKTGDRATLTCDKLKEADEWDAIPLRLTPRLKSLVVTAGNEAQAGVADVDRLVEIVEQHGPCSLRGLRDRARGMGTDRVRHALDVALLHGRLEQPDRNSKIACPTRPDTPDTVHPPQDLGGVSDASHPKGGHVQTRPAEGPEHDNWEAELERQAALIEGDLR